MQFDFSTQQTSTSRVGRAALACALATTMLTSFPAASIAQDLTDVGTPRAETLFVYMLNARVANLT